MNNHSQTIKNNKDYYSILGPIYTSLPSTSFFNIETYNTRRVYNTSKIFSGIGWQQSFPTGYSKNDESYEEMLRNSVNISLTSDLFKKLREFEIKFNMDSHAFYDKYMRGEEKDTEEFNAWASLYSLMK